MQFSLPSVEDSPLLLWIPEPIQKVQALSPAVKISCQLHSVSCARDSEGAHEAAEAVSSNSGIEISLGLNGL
jgi:hypothetical protein